MQLSLTYFRHFFGRQRIFTVVEPERVCLLKFNSYFPSSIWTDIKDGNLKISQEFIFIMAEKSKMF